MNKSSVALFAPLLVLSLMGLGCNPFAGVQEKINQKIGDTVAEKILESGSGGKVDVNSEDGSFSFKDSKTGESVSFGENVKIPDGFPSDVPRYDGSQASVASLAKDGKQATLVVTIKNVELAKLAEWYESQILAKGYEKDTNTVLFDSMFNSYKKGNVTMTVVLLGEKGDDGVFTASVNITREEGTE